MGAPKQQQSSSSATDRAAPKRLQLYEIVPNVYSVYRAEVLVSMPNDALHELLQGPQDSEFVQARMAQHFDSIAVHSAHVAAQHVAAQRQHDLDWDVQETWVSIVQIFALVAICALYIPCYPIVWCVAQAVRLMEKPFAAVIRIGDNAIASLRWVSEPEESLPQACAAWEEELEEILAVPWP